jgi:hypothetical protein
MTNPIWLGAGGDVSFITDASCKKLYDLGVRDIHSVVGYLGTYSVQLAAIKKYGMAATYDLEIPLWDNPPVSMQVGVDISWAKGHLLAVKAAGWDYAASEGLGNSQTNVIRSIMPFINYGDEYGADMYAGQYAHDPDAHFANLLESYHTQSEDQYLNSAKSSWAKCKNFGLTLQMFAQTSDLETVDNVLAYLDKLEAMGIRISEVLFWVGWGCDIMHYIFNSPWIDIINALKNRYGLRTESAWSSSTLGPMPPAVRTPTVITLDQTNATPAVGQTITLTTQLRGGQFGNRLPLSGKKVRIWHTYEGNKTWVDGEGITDAAGQFSCPVTFKSAGARQYYATFEGDDNWLPAGSGIIDVI